MFLSHFKEKENEDEREQLTLSFKKTLRICHLLNIEVCFLPLNIQLVQLALLFLFLTDLENL